MDEQACTRVGAGNVRTGWICSTGLPKVALTSGLRLRLADLDRLYIKSALAWEDRACRRSCPRRGKGTFQVNNTARRPKITVSADGQGLVSQAGALLLA